MTDSADSLPSDADLAELVQEVAEADEEAAAHRAAADAALQAATEARLGDDEAVAAAAGEQTHDDADAAGWAQEEHIDAAAAATAAEAATARRKEKKWTCADCGKAHKERSAVRGKGGGYVCLEGCGRADGGAPRAQASTSKRQRPLEAGS